MACALGLRGELVAKIAVSCSLQDRLCAFQLGCPAQYHNPKYLAAVHRIYESCAAKGIPLVIHFFTYEMAEPWIEKGVRLVLFGTDRAGISDRMQTDFAHLRGLP